jgi:hypothetical protein
MNFTLRLIPAAVATCLLASCGGGGGTDPDSFVPPTVTPTGGVAIDGYLAGATVLCDSNGNGQADAGELSVGTNRNGAFSFAQGCTAGLVASGGASVDTGLLFVGLLKAPAGATVISPLTTLMAAGLTQEQLVTALGLPAGTPSFLTTDPALKNSDGTLVRPDLLKATLVVQQLLQKTAEMFAGLGGVSDAATLRALYTRVVMSVPSLGQSSAPLIAGSDVNDSVVARLVAAAATQVATAPEVPTSVSAAVAALNAESLAQVSSGGLALQAEAILNSPEPKLTEATFTAQTDTQVTSFIVGNASQLTGPPSDATAALAQQLIEQYVPAPPPTDYIAIANDAISLVNGSSTRSYTMAQFQSAAGISISWPMPAPMLMKVTGIEVGTYVIPTGQKLTAAVSISETTANGQGQMLGYIENVDVRKTAAGLEITVPPIGGSPTSALAYVVSGDGKKKAVIDFAADVAGVTNTLTTAVGQRNSLVIGEVVNFAVNKVSNDFTGIYELRGKYAVSVVVSGLPLRKADGTMLPAVTIEVPTVLNSSGGVVASKTVTGSGLVGYITLTD